MKVKTLIKCLSKYDEDTEAYLSCKSDGIENEIEIKNVINIECEFNEPLGVKSGVYILFE